MFYLGFFPIQSSYGLTHFSTDFPVLFSMYIAEFTSSAQIASGNFISVFEYLKVLAISTIVRFSRSLPPFCSGVYGAVSLCVIPFLVKFSLFLHYQTHRIVT